MPNSDTIKVDYHGLPEVIAICNELPTRAIKRGDRRAMNLAATPIVRSMRSYIPKKSGLMKKSIKKKIKTFQDGKSVAFIGPDRNVTAAFPKSNRTKPRKYANYRPAFVAHLVDGGHGGQRGPAAATPFIKPAFEATKDIAFQIYREKLVETLEAEAIKMGRK